MASGLVVPVDDAGRHRGGREVTTDDFAFLLLLGNSSSSSSSSKNNNNNMGKQTRLVKQSLERQKELDLSTADIIRLAFERNSRAKAKHLKAQALAEGEQPESAAAATAAVAAAAQGFADVGGNAETSAEHGGAAMARARQSRSSTASSIDSTASSGQSAAKEKNVQVLVRVRPPKSMEIKLGIADDCIDGSNIQIDNEIFPFDDVFDSSTDQATIYDSCFTSTLDHILKGFHATVLVYGQTGSGKTYTMGMTKQKSPEHNGVLQRFIHQLYERLPAIRQEIGQDGAIAVRASAMEVHNQSMKDLSVPPKAIKKAPKLKVVNRGGRICVDNLRKHSAASEEDILQFLYSSLENRITAATKMNATSSRSHAIFEIEITTERPTGQQAGSSSELLRQTTVGRITFVDLAGSERIKRTGATKQRAREGININQGLSALGNVIRALNSSKGGMGSSRGASDRHVPYRDSILTRVLQNAIGGNSRTVFLACVSPTHDDFDESITTLRYALRARRVKNLVASQTSTRRAASRRLVAELTVAALSDGTGLGSSVPVSGVYFFDGYWNNQPKWRRAVSTGATASTQNLGSTGTSAFDEGDATVATVPVEGAGNGIAPRTYLYFSDTSSEPAWELATGEMMGTSKYLLRSLGPALRQEDKSYLFPHECGASWEVARPANCTRDRDSPAPVRLFVQESSQSSKMLHVQGRGNQKVLGLMKTFILDGEAAGRPRWRLQGQFMRENDVHLYLNPDQRRWEIGVLERNLVFLVSEQSSLHAIRPATDSGIGGSSANLTAGSTYCLDSAEDADLLLHPKFCKSWLMSKTTFLGLTRDQPVDLTFVPPLALASAEAAAFAGTTTVADAKSASAFARSRTPRVQRTPSRRTPARRGSRATPRSRAVSRGTPRQTPRRAQSATKSQGRGSTPGRSAIRQSRTPLAVARSSAAKGHSKAVVEASPIVEVEEEDADEAEQQECSPVGSLAARLDAAANEPTSPVPPVMRTRTTPIPSKRTLERPQTTPVQASHNNKENGHWTPQQEQQEQQQQQKKQQQQVQATNEADPSRWSQLPTFYEVSPNSLTPTPARSQRFLSLLAAKRLSMSANPHTRHLSLTLSRSASARDHASGGMLSRTTGYRNGGYSSRDALHGRGNLGSTFDETAETNEDDEDDDNKGGKMSQWPAERRATAQIAMFKLHRLHRSCSPGKFARLCASNGTQHRREDMDRMSLIDQLQSTNSKRNSLRLSSPVQRKTPAKSAATPGIETTPTRLTPGFSSRTASLLAATAPPSRGASPCPKPGDSASKRVNRTPVKTFGVVQRSSPFGGSPAANVIASSALSPATDCSPRPPSYPPPRKVMGALTNTLTYNSSPAQVLDKREQVDEARRQLEKVKNILANSRKRASSGNRSRRSIEAVSQISKENDENNPSGIISTANADGQRPRALTTESEQERNRAESEFDIDDDEAEGRMLSKIATARVMRLAGLGSLLRSSRGKAGAEAGSSEDDELASVPRFRKPKRKGRPRRLRRSNSSQVQQRQQQSSLDLDSGMVDSDVDEAAFEAEVLAKAGCGCFPFSKRRKQRRHLDEQMRQQQSNGARRARW